MRWELTKILKLKSMWVFLAIFMFLNVYWIREKQKTVADPISGHEAIMRQVEGKITNNKIKLVSEALMRATHMIESGKAQPGKYDSSFYTGYAYGDQYEFDVLYHELSYCYFYSSDMQTLINKIDEFILQTSVPGQLQKQKDLILKTYGNRHLLEYYETDSVKSYLEYNNSEIFVLLLMILILPTLIYRDREGGMTGIISTGASGCVHYMLNKCVAAFIWIASISLLFFIEDIFAFGVEKKGNVLEQPLYLIEEYQQCMFRYSIREFMVCNLLCKIVFYFVLCILILILSLWIKKAIFAATASIMCIGGMVIAEWYYMNTLNPVGLLGLLQQQQKFQTVVLAGVFVPHYIANIIWTVVEMIFLIGMLAVSSERVKELG